MRVSADDELDAGLLQYRSPKLTTFARPVGEVVRIHLDAVVRIRRTALFRKKRDVAEDDLERSFYEKECIAQKWDVRTLKRQMSSALYLRLAASKDKEGVLALAKEGITVQKPEDEVRDRYTLEFLGIQIWR